MKPLDEIHIGMPVLYYHGPPTHTCEPGIVTGWNDMFVFVRFGDHNQAGLACGWEQVKHSNWIVDLPVKKPGRIIPDPIDLGDKTINFHQDPLTFMTVNYGAKGGKASEE